MCSAASGSRENTDPSLGFLLRGESMSDDLTNAVSLRRAKARRATRHAKRTGNGGATEPHLFVAVGQASGALLREFTGFCSDQFPLLLEASERLWGVVDLQHPLNPSATAIGLRPACSAYYFY